MAAQPKTAQTKALLNRTLTKDQLLEMIATGWTVRRIAEHASTLTGQAISHYYIVKTLQSYGDEYQEAKKQQARLQAERVADIADKVEEGKLDPASARVAAENRRWVASKLDPSTYGDKVAMDVQLTDVTAMHLQAMRDAMKIVETIPAKQGE
jgi:hypothetical protein